MPPTPLPTISDGEELLNLGTGELFLALPQASAELLRDLAIRYRPCGDACEASSCRLARAVLATFPVSTMQPRPAALASTDATRDVEPTTAEAVHPKTSEDGNA